MSREDEILNSHYQLLKQTLETAKLNNIIEKGDVQIVDLAKKANNLLHQIINEILQCFVFFVLHLPL